MAGGHPGCPPAPPPLRDPLGHPPGAPLHPRGRRDRLPAGFGIPGGVPLHPRDLPDDVSGAAVDHAPIRRLRHRRGVQPALPLPAGSGPDRPLGGLRPPHPAGLRRRPPHGPRGGRPGGGQHLLPGGHAAPAGRHPPGPGQPLHDHQRPGGDPAGHGPRPGPGAGRGLEAAAGHGPERHPQRICGPWPLHLPARALHAAGRGRDGFLPPTRAELEPHQHQRLPHPGGRRHRGPGGGLHLRPCPGVCAGRRSCRPLHRRHRPPALVLLQRPQPFPGGSGQVPRRPPAVGPPGPGSPKGHPPRGDDAPLPCANGRQHPHRSAAREQHHPGDDPGPGRHPGRLPVPPHQRHGRSPLAAH
jgi:hypothetical protein